MTFRWILSDLSELLKQNIANRKYTWGEIAFWVQAQADYLKSRHIPKIDSGAFVHEYSQLPVLTDAVTGRKYIEIPGNIYDFDLDGGVAYLSFDYTLDGCSPTFTSVKFTHTTPAKSIRLYYTEDEYPKPDNPYFYRIGNRAYFLGVECINLSMLEGGFYSTFNPEIACSLDDEFDFPVELYPILQRQILDLARFGLQIPNNRKNTGNFELDELMETVPKSKLTTAADAVTTTDTTE